MHAFGDSITLALAGGASAQSKGYAALIAAARGRIIDNQGIRGAQIADMADPIMRTAVNSGTQSFGLFGFNDNYLRGAAGIAPFCETLKALGAWLAIPDSNKITARSPSIAYAGGWADNGAYGGGLGRVTVSSGDSASFRLAGSVIYIAIERFTEGGGACRILVDGNLAGEWSCAGGSASYLGATHSPTLIRIPNLTNNEHEVTISKTAASGALALIWAAGIHGDGGCITHPSFHVGNCIRMDATGYGWGTAGASESTAAAYNAAMLSVIESLRADGLRVFYVNAFGAFDPIVDGSGDHTHPSDQGHAHIAQAFLSIMS